MKATMEATTMTEMTTDGDNNGIQKVPRVMETMPRMEAMTEE